MTTNSNLEVPVDEHEASRVTGISVGSLRRRRLLGMQPPYLKVGARVLYMPSALSDFLRSCTVRGRQ
jgi:hypothetical protein